MFTVTSWELLLNATTPVRHREFGLPTEARWQSLRLHVVNWQPFAVANCTQTMSTFMFVYTLNTSLSIAQLATRICQNDTITGTIPN